jgi:hypothetical protein
MRRRGANGDRQERRVATPNPDLFVLKLGKQAGKRRTSNKERASGLIQKLAKAVTKPGADRSHVFRSISGKPVYAYSIYAEDPTKVVREDANGRETIGRVVDGRFRPTKSVRAQ